MIPFKQIGDRLSVSEYNAIVYLLRKNSPFTDKIKIKDGSIFGEYGEYIFDLDMVTIVDNGILITKETLSNIGTVKLNNPIFPNSTYTLNMKVYSMDNINVLEEDDAEIIITPLSIILKEGEEVNIPFETLDLTNIIAFDATISIEHTGIVKSNDAYLSVDSVDKSFPNVGVPLTATYYDMAGQLVGGKIVNFYDGNDVLIGTATTNNEGIATIHHSWDSVGTYSFYATSDSIISTSKSINIDDTGDLVFKIFDNTSPFIVEINHYCKIPFAFDGDGLSVDFGDGSVEWYTGGRLIHTYAIKGQYDIKMVGPITQLNDYCFAYYSGLKSITIPNTVTTIGYKAFEQSLNLSTINIPKSVTKMGSDVFAYSDMTIIQLNWDSASSIIQYNSSWVKGCYGFRYFLIPEGTTSLYVAKGYPANRLMEEGQGFDGISVSSTQDVLSYADGDSTVLSAQLTSSGSPVSVSGESVTFEVRKQSDDSLVETLSDTTDNTGLASVEYFGKGVGDLNITVKCRSVIETYNIEDCDKYDITEHTHTSTSSSSTSVSIYEDYSFDFTNFEVSFDMKLSNDACGIYLEQTTNRNNFFGIGEGNGGLFRGYYNNGTGEISQNISASDVNYHSCKIIKQDNNIKYYFDNNLVWSLTVTGMDVSRSPKYRSWSSNRTIYIKNVKIKKL